MFNFADSPASNFFHDESSEPSRQSYVIVGENEGGSLRLELLSTEPSLESLTANARALLCVRCTQQSIQGFLAHLFTLDTGEPLSTRMEEVKAGAIAHRDNVVLWSKTTEPL